MRIFPPPKHNQLIFVKTDEYFQYINPQPIVGIQKIRVRMMQNLDSPHLPPNVSVAWV